MSQSQQHKLAVVFFTHAGSHPGAMMIELPHTPTTPEAMLSPGHLFTVADITKLTLIQILEVPI